jgi:hypothetical protein
MVRGIHNLPFLEPTSEEVPAKIDALRFIYGGGIYNAVLLLDPSTKDLYVITERGFYGKDFLLKYPQSTTERNISRRNNAQQFCNLRREQKSRRMGNRFC